MSTGSSRVCVIGSVNVDTTYSVPSLPEPGETVLAGHKSLAPGGKGANQAVAAAAMGSQVSFVGSVGHDPEGSYVLDALRRRGVDVSQVTTVDGTSSGTAVLVVDEHGENVIVVDPGANQRIPPERVAAHLGAVDYDVVLSQMEINSSALLMAATSCRSTFVLNPAPFREGQTVSGELLERTDVLVPNRVELARLVGRQVPVDQAELDECVHSLGFAGVVLVTLGSGGAALYEPDRARPRLIEPVHVQSVDASGAGDVFCGVFSHVLAQEGDLYLAASRANDVAAWSTTVRGAQLPAPGVTDRGRQPWRAAPAL